MAKNSALSTHDTSTTMPAGIPYIVGNEAAERFSFYGMKAILVVFMTQYLKDHTGQPAFTEPEAMVWYHNFVSAAYFFPLIGAVVSDVIWGKYKTIMNLSIIYCLGHLALALFESKMGLAVGLTLIAIGSGGIKPCVSANVGDQFGEHNKHLLPKVFSIFYFSINFGAFFSTLLTPLLMQKVGPSIAFGVPGILMFLATFVFWLGRKNFVAIPPVGWEVYRRDVFSAEGLKSILNLMVVYLFIAVFWALYDQTGSSWVLQSEHMDRMVNLGFVQFEMLASQVQAINPVLIMAFIPLFTYVLYPMCERLMVLTPLRKIGFGFFLTVVSFGIVAVAQSRLDGGAQVSILWQVVAYLLITAAEVLVSITALEFSYTQAPNSMKSLIMGFYLLSVTLGNQLTAVVNTFIQDENGQSTMSGADYYWFFTYLMLGTALVYSVVAKFYRGKTYVQHV